MTNIRSCKFLSKTFLESFSTFKVTFLNVSNFSKEILTFWYKLGEERGFHVYTQQKYASKATSEYLVDLCWYFESDENCENWMELALESELSGQNLDYIEDDFTKLVDIKAFTKVGIFRPLLKEKVEVLERLSEMVSFSGIRIPIEKYLIIFIIDHGVRENSEKRMEVCTYQIDFQGEILELDTKRFPG